jgi:GT2 family glycosyltransferase
VAPGTAQVVVVDNASGDGSAEALAAGHPDVTLVRSAENLGFARATNIGFTHATGEFLVLLNSDTIVLPGALEALVDHLRRHPDVGAVGGMQLDAERNFHPSGNWFPSAWVDLSVVVGLHRLRWWFLERGHPLARLWFETKTGDVDWLSGSFMAVRRQVVEEVGPLPEEFFLYGEDLEWCWRMKQAGWRRVYLHGTPIVHLESRSAALRADSQRRMLDGFSAFARRHRNPLGWRVCWLALAAYWTALALRWGVRARLGRDASAGATARSLRGHARRHIDHVLGRIPAISP